jgi:hypothetical protein
MWFSENYRWPLITPQISFTCPKAQSIGIAYSLRSKNHSQDTLRMIPQPTFHAAYEQINRWRAWFANESNRNGFINGTISLIRAPGHWMWQNQCFIKFVLVHGRRAEFEGNEIRRRILRGLETDEFHILSYDSLMESLHSKGELYVARRKNEHIEVLTERYVSEGLLTSVDPSYLKITDELRQSALDHRELWHEVSLEGRCMALDLALPKIGRLRLRDKSPIAEG